MSNAQDVIRDSIQQVYKILENIDQLLLDADEALVEHGFEGMHSGYQCDISKQSAVAMMPYHVSAFYGRQDAGEAGRQNTLGLGVLLTNDGREPVEPLLVGAVFCPRDPNTPYVAWWVHSAVMSPGLEQLPVPALPALPYDVAVKRGSQKSKANYWYDQAYYFTVPLTEMSSAEVLEERFVKPLLDLHEGVSGLR